MGCERADHGQAKHRILRSLHYNSCSSSSSSSSTSSSSERPVHQAHQLGCIGIEAKVVIETVQDMFITPLYQQHASHTLASRAYGPQPHMRSQSATGPYITRWLSSLSPCLSVWCRGAQGVRGKIRRARDGFYTSAASGPSSAMVLVAQSPEPAAAKRSAAAKQAKASRMDSQASSGESSSALVVAAPAPAGAAKSGGGGRVKVQVKAATACGRHPYGESLLQAVS